MDGSAQWCACGALSHAWGWASQVSHTVVTGIVVCVCAWPLDLPAHQESSQATVSFNLLFTVDVTVIITATWRGTQL